MADAFEAENVGMVHDSVDHHRADAALRERGND